MKTISVLYAAVGAPVVAARKVGEKVTEVSEKMNEQASGYSETAGKAIDGWAVEGEKVVGKVRERKVVDEITAKVDLDQAKEQVTKLRDQLEDMLATWRTSFRPEKTETKTSASKASETKASETKTAPKATAKKSETKASATKASATKASATKASATKASAAKTTKSTAAKTSEPKTESVTKAEKAS